jgi:2-haloalkanoic acid dehalogenase type II
MPAPRVRALFFDVFGTLFDWRDSLIRSLNAFGERTGTACDWEGLVDAWRGAYVPSMARVRAGELAWRNLDELHAASLDELAERFGLALGADDRAWIVRRWHALDPWPDVPAGLARLRDRYLLSTLSNGSVALLAALARRADLRFDTTSRTPKRTSARLPYSAASRTKRCSSPRITTIWMRLQRLDFTRRSSRDRPSTARIRTRTSRQATVST